MDFTAFSSEVKRSRAIAPVTVFYGEEGVLRDRGVILIREAIGRVPPDPIRLATSGLTWPALLSELYTPPFWGEKKLVVLADEGNYLHNHVENLKAYCSGPSSCAYLVVTVPMDKSPIPFEGKNLKVISCQPLKPYEVEQWISAECERRGRVAGKEVAALLRARVGLQLGSLLQEIEKVTTHAQGKHVTPADVELLVGAAPEAKLFELTLAVVARDVSKALMILHRLLAQGENIQGLIAKVAWQYRKLAEARKLLDAGRREFEIPSLVQVTFYPNEFMAAVKKHRMGELLQKHAEILKADVALKTTGGNESAILEGLVCRLASASGALVG